MEILRNKKDFLSKKEIKQHKKEFLKNNKEIKPKKQDSKLYFNNMIAIKELEKKLVNIDKLKDKLKEKGLSKKDRYKYISKALIKNSELKIHIATLLKDINTLEYIQPYQVCRQLKGNTDLSMRLKKSKGVINRHCYR